MNGTNGSINLSKDNERSLHELDGIEYNSQMSCDKLRTNTLKEVVVLQIAQIVVARQIKA